MKVGILGTGKIVQEFLPWLVEHAPFTVQALCSTPRSAEKAQELCRQYGVPQHTTNYLELLQWVDVVYIAVPNLQHVRFARVALEAGKHVIVEKPLAPSAAQTEELVALARHKKVFLFEAVTTQYLENYAKIRELLPRVGTVRLVQCNFSQYSSRYDAFCAGETPPVFDPASQRAVTEAKDAAVWPEGKEKSSGREMRSCTSARISQGRMRATSGLRMRLQRTASTRSAAASTQPTRRVLRKTNSTAVSAAQMKPASPRWVKKSIPASKIWVRSPCKTVRSISSTFIKRSLSRFVVYRIPEVYE